MVESAKPSAVVEFGSGASSSVIAAALRRIGRGHLWSFDESQRFAGRTRQKIAERDLSGYATVLHRSLCHQSYDRSNFYCYDLTDLPAACNGIDLVFIDGPNSAAVVGNPGSRSGTLPLVKPLLAPGALIILDDANRQNEKKIVRGWERDYQFKVVAELDIGRGLLVGIL